MMNSPTKSAARPIIFNYTSISEYLMAMLNWRKEDEPQISVRQLTKAVPGCSPSLVTLVLKGKRKLTRDRVQFFSKLLKLTRQETSYLDQWVENERNPVSAKLESKKNISLRKRSEPQNHLLSDWVNPYVKDTSALKGFEPKPEIIFRLLGGMVPLKRVEKSLGFLMREGFLRRTPSGKVVENVGLATTTDDVPSGKIRQFHKQALNIASRSIDIYPIDKRRANAVLMALDHASVQELEVILKDFYERLMVFTEDHVGESEGLYQVLINLSPIGGSLDH